jgi:hypothetical protein
MDIRIPPLFILSVQFLLAHHRCQEYNKTNVLSLYPFLVLGRVGGTISHSMHAYSKGARSRPAASTAPSLLLPP